jgi:Outer membrane protein beta-barrel domain
MKPSFRLASFTFSMMFALGIAGAQTSLDVHAGVSGANAKSSGQLVDTFGDGNLYQTPSLNGVFMNFGAGAMITPRFGFGGEFSFKPAKSDYAGLSYRPMFYDFNGIFHPAPSAKRIVPEIQSGIGGVNMRFYYSQSNCNVIGCSSQNTYLQSTNHFQWHASAGVKFYVRPSLYVEPKFDMRYVRNFEQFGTNWVPQYGVNVGYRFGD